MQLSPNQLSSGWIIRCGINSLKLSLRSPLLWLVLYVCLPILTYYIPYLPLTTFVAGLIIVFGTFLCFANDHLSKYAIKDYLALLIMKPQPVIILVVCMVTSIFMFNSSMALSLDTPISALLRFGMALLSLYISVLLSSVSILLLYDIPMAFFKYYILPRKGELDSDLPNLHVIAGSFSVFSIHLIVDTKLDWKSACDLSVKGVEVLRLRDRMILIAPISLLFVFPVLLGFFVPFYYCVYRELFWQTGISEKEFASKAITAH